MSSIILYPIKYNICRERQVDLPGLTIPYINRHDLCLRVGEMRKSILMPISWIEQRENIKKKK